MTSPQAGSVGETGNYTPKGGNHEGTSHVMETLKNRVVAPRDGEAMMEHLTRRDAPAQSSKRRGSAAGVYGGVQCRRLPLRVVFERCLVKTVRASKG